jgi:predicted ATPase/DNA-binding SARP family transcriptional activator
VVGESARDPTVWRGRSGVEFCVLGRISIVAEGREHVLGSTREAALLADLIVHAGEVVPASRLIDDVWRGEPPPGASGTLQTYVKNLRRMLEPSRPTGAPGEVLVLRRPGYVLNVAADGLDAWRCKRLIDEGRAALGCDDPALAVDRFRDALALWRGPAYGDLATESYVQSEAARLEELRLVAIEQRARADLALGHHAELCGELEALVAAHPYRERLWAHWMLALYRAARQADALRAYQRLRRVLGDELGIDPSDELRDLEEAILVHKPYLDWTPPPSHRPPGVPSNLPAERSVFVGRRRELSTIAGLVRSARLVTLTGVGGVGKTRLAVQTAAGLIGEFPSGVWLVELAPLTDSALVAATVASALGVSLAGGVDSTEAVCRFLAQRRALVILDNCEHVIEAAAAFVDRLLAAGPEVRVLATSRERLDVAGESAWRVPSLSLDGDADALALFAERAAQAQPGLSLADPATKASAMAVCRRLDGIPLAIELAAARAKVLSVDQIAARLDERFRLLTGGGRTAVPRQQTLHGAIGWSYDLLTAAQRSLFDTLGVFAGEFDLDAVATVANLDPLEALDLVEQLVNKSMVEADPGRDRYRLLETLRQYACARLVAGGRLGDVRDAHAASFAVLAARQARRMGEGGEHVDALDRLDADYDNLRAALTWLIEQRRADAAARMVRRLSGLFQIRHPREGLDWFQAVMAIGGDLPDKVRARVLAGAAWAALHAGDVEATARYAGAATEADGDQPASAPDWLLALVAIWAGDYARAAEHLRREIPSAVANNDLTRQTFATAVLVLALAELGDEPEARRLIPEAIGLAERLGDPSMLAITYDQVAVALVRIGAPHEAVTVWEHGLIHVDTAGPIMACAYRCSYALNVDDPPTAARILAVAIPIANEQLSGFQQAHPLLAAAAITAATGQERIAARLLGAFNQYGKGTGFVNVSQDNERLANRLHDRLGAAVVEDELAHGAQLTIGHALQLAEDTIVAMT